MINYQNLEAWKCSMNLVKEVYILTRKYPKDETYGLTSQTKRAAVSIPSNIAEGLGRNYKKESIQFLHIARGSIYELKTQIELAKILGFILEVELENIEKELSKTLKLLNGLIKYMEKAEIR